MGAIPAGFALMPTMGLFHDFVGPVYVKQDDTRIVAGLMIEERHCNLGGNIHGGMVGTLVDSAFAYAVRKSQDPPVRGVTTTMAIDFIGTAEPGQWIEAHVDVVRSGRRVVFLNCFVWCEANRIARASATFQVVGSYDGAATALKPPAVQEHT